MKKRGIDDNKFTSGLKNLEFARELFNSWDDDGSGVLEISEIVRPLVALGLSPDETFVVKVRVFIIYIFSYYKLLVLLEKS
jgi:hypothetical protein